MTNREKIKTRKVRKVTREKETPDEEFQRMLELYTMVPPRPGKIKRKRKAGKSNI